jgi:hypothetical protein
VGAYGFCGRRRWKPSGLGVASGLGTGGRRPAFAALLEGGGSQAGGRRLKSCWRAGGS